MDEREVEVLLTLAGELHFRRTAERLHISTAAVSQTVARLERRIGAALFVRTSRRVELTPIGRRLVDEIAPARARIDAAVRDAVDAARGLESRLRIGYMSAAVAGVVIPAAGEFQRTRPGCEVTITETSLSDLFGPLRTDAVDVSVLPLPVREDDLHVATVVLSEPAVVALPRAHRLAHRVAVSAADLADETVLEVGGTPDYWRRPWPVGEPNRTPQITGFQELLALVEAGRGIAVVGGQSATYYPRPGLTFVPFVDGPPFEYAAVRRAGPAPAVVTDFIGYLPVTASVASGGD